jgi:microsomal dipeptidase-like Zn-dependent dipeptidase
MFSAAAAWIRRFPSPGLDNPRNAPNELIEAVAKTGGVIGLTTVSDFYTRTRKVVNVAHTPQATLDKELGHYDYLKKLVGADHIGIAPDFMTSRTDLDDIARAGMDRTRWPADVYSEMPWQMVRGFETVVELPNLTQGLLNRGWKRGGRRQGSRRELAARVREGVGRIAMTQFRRRQCPCGVWNAARSARSRRRT